MADGGSPDVEAATTEQPTAPQQGAGTAGKVEGGGGQAEMKTVSLAHGLPGNLVEPGRHLPAVALHDAPHRSSGAKRRLGGELHGTRAHDLDSADQRR